MVLLGCNKKRGVGYSCRLPLILGHRARRLSEILMIDRRGYSDHLPPLPFCWGCQVAPMAAKRQDLRMPWILIGGALVVAIVFALIESGRRRRGRDLGVISDQWMAQH